MPIIMFQSSDFLTFPINVQIPFSKDKGVRRQSAILNKFKYELSSFIVLLMKVLHINQLGWVGVTSCTTAHNSIVFETAQMM